MPNQPIVVTTEYRGMRNFHKDAYNYCARCGSRVQISDMEWQRGLLLCKKWDCIDYGNKGFPLVGERESYINAVLSDPERELQPNEKLVTPNESGSDADDEIYF